MNNENSVLPSMTTVLTEITPTPTQLKWQAIVATVGKANATAKTAGGMNRLDKSTRLKLGKDVEKAIVEYLAASGLPITAASEQLDMVDKIDVLLTIAGQTYKGQVKFRVEGRKDIGIEIFRPFYSSRTNPRTRKGRDYVSQYDFYIVFIEGVIYMVWGKAQKALLGTILQAWEDDECPRPFRYEEGIELRFTQDEGEDDGGDSKMMGYIPPAVLAKRQMALPWNEYISTRPVGEPGLLSLFTTMLNRWKAKYSEEE